MNLKSRLKRLEEATLTEKQAMKASEYIEALTDYLLDETPDNDQRLKDTGVNTSFVMRQAPEGK